MSRLIQTRYSSPVVVKFGSSTKYIIYVYMHVAIFYIFPILLCTSIGHDCFNFHLKTSTMFDYVNDHHLQSSAHPSHQTTRNSPEFLRCNNLELPVRLGFLYHVAVPFFGGEGVSLKKTILKEKNLVHTTFSFFLVGGGRGPCFG